METPTQTELRDALACVEETRRLLRWQTELVVELLEKLAREGAMTAPAGGKFRGE